MSGVLESAKRLTNVTSKAGSFAYAYNGGQASRLPIKLALPNTSYITNMYDSVTRLTGTWLKNSTNGTLNSHEYTYNGGNQRTQQVFNVGSTYNYTYDAIGQLKVGDSGTGSEDRGYTYDAAWNLYQRTNNGVVGTFTVDGKNQLTASPTTTYTHDANGNLNSWQGGYGTYSYDDENRLITAQFYATWKTDFVYDGLGRLRRRIEYTGPGAWTVTSDTRYVYDGWRVIQERDTNNTPLASYTRGNDSSGSLEGAGGIGGLLARSHGYASTNGNWYTHNCYHADGNGNITYLVNSSQTLAAKYRYDPFGNTISSSGSLASANVYRFSSKENHVNSGMYYYGYRWYDPNLQRWLNRDPIGVNGGINLYEFINNSPIHSIDAFGHQLWYCTTPTTMFGGIGRHGYIWNDDPTIPDEERECGQERCSSTQGQAGSNNNGPRRDNPEDNYDSQGRWHGSQRGPGDSREIECASIGGTDDDAANQKFMKSCRANINDNLWLGPGIWDCHNSARSCLRDGGHEMPPFRRWNTQPPFGEYPTPPPILRSPKDQGSR